MMVLAQELWCYACAGYMATCTGATMPLVRRLASTHLLPHRPFLPTHTRCILSSHARSIRLGHQAARFRQILRASEAHLQFPQRLPPPRTAVSLPLLTTETSHPLKPASPPPRFLAPEPCPSTAARPLCASPLISAPLYLQAKHHLW